MCVCVSFWFKCFSGGWYTWRSLSEPVSQLVPWRSGCRRWWVSCDTVLCHRTDSTLLGCLLSLLSVPVCGYSVIVPDGGGLRVADVTRFPSVVGGVNQQRLHREGLQVPWLKVRHVLSAEGKKNYLIISIIVLQTTQRRYPSPSLLNLLITNWCFFLQKWSSNLHQAQQQWHFLQSLDTHLLISLTYWEELACVSLSLSNLVQKDVIIHLSRFWIVFIMLRNCKIVFEITWFWHQSTTESYLKRAVWTRK